MEGFLTRLSYFFTRDFKTYTMNMKFKHGVLATKRELVHLLLERNKRYPEMTSREQVNG